MLFASSGEAGPEQEGHHSGHPSMVANLLLLKESGRGSPNTRACSSPALKELCSWIGDEAAEKKGCQAKEEASGA